MENIVVVAFDVIQDLAIEIRSRSDGQPAVAVQ